jgi:hypothetical protein
MKTNARQESTNHPDTVHPMHGPDCTKTRVQMRRRTLLVSTLAGIAVCALPRLGSVAEATVLPGSAANRRFSIFYKGDRVGTHTVSYSAATGQKQVTTRIDIVVQAFFTFTYKHNSVEIWRDGRLMSLNSETVEHGRTLRVTGTATPQGFRIVNNAGSFIASRNALTSNSLWTTVVLKQRTLIDAQHGGVMGLSVRKVADERIEVAGRRIRATRYRFITPYLAGSIWYDTSSRWVRGEFERDGAQILYLLDR